MRSAPAVSFYSPGFVEISSGAAAIGALRVEGWLRSGVVVTIFHDSGDKYLANRFVSDNDDELGNI